jgi:hypothetical protein
VDRLDDQQRRTGVAKTEAGSHVLEIAVDHTLITSQIKNSTYSATIQRTPPPHTCLAGWLAAQDHSTEFEDKRLLHNTPAQHRRTPI